MQHWEAEAPNAIMGWTVFQPRREQWTRQRYQAPESLRSRPQLENRAPMQQCWVRCVAAAAPAARISGLLNEMQVEAQGDVNQLIGVGRRDKGIICMQSRPQEVGKRTVTRVLYVVAS